MPKVSVILPVFNAENYLHEAIQSILGQTLTDFELIIINDGSSDRSGEIISSFDDPRIVSVSNEKNEGLIYTLNKAIDQATGEYLARMDADDVALPGRLQKQVHYLETNKAHLVATRVHLIDEQGNSLPPWDADERNIEPGEISSFLLSDNCIAHPTVMGKTHLFRKYRYQANQKYSEDYDLWLRMITDGCIIAKISEPLLLHRILQTSATRFKKVNTFYRLSKVKFRFLREQLKKGNMNAYNRQVFSHALIDLVKAGGKELKGVFTK